MLEMHSNPYRHFQLVVRQYNVFDMRDVLGKDGIWKPNAKAAEPISAQRDAPTGNVERGDAG